MGGESSKIRNRIPSRNTPPTSQPENKTDQPPSYYTTFNTKAPQEHPSQRIFITAESIPQWTWTHKECTSWLRDVLSTTMGLSGYRATELAAAFEGCGRTLWHKNIDAWVDWLGWDIGQAMHSLMRECYDARARSGIPNSVVVNQFIRPRMTSST